MPKYSGKRDANEPKLITLARQLGAKFEKYGPLDWWMYHAKTQWVPVEIKDEDGHYTAKQIDFINKCHAWHMPVMTWRTRQDVLDSLGGTDTWKPSTPMQQNNSPADTPSAQSVKIAERCL